MGISRTTIAQIDELLKSRNFVRRKANWNRKNEGYIDVVDLQISKSGDTFAVNSGVMDLEVYEICWGGKPTTFVEEPACTVRARIGELAVGSNSCWQLDDVNSVDNVCEKLVAHVLPFLERMHSPQAMEHFLEEAKVFKFQYPPPIIYLAVLKYKQGKEDDAYALLDEIHKKSGEPWKAKISEAAERMGNCPKTI